MKEKRKRIKVVGKKKKKKTLNSASITYKLLRIMWFF